jgi:peptidoglycan/LPS O-acetylase OafA/YrhL
MIITNSQVDVVPDHSVPLPKLLWLDRMKAIALLWIVLNHVIEPIFGGILMGWPTSNWPPLSARLAQLQPLDLGLWTIPVNGLRYLGWFGDQGVGLFLILSGFGLTWGVLERYGQGALPLQTFLMRRLARLYPMWWVLHAVFIGLWCVTGYGLALTDIRSYVSLTGLRIFSSSFFYYFEPSWWFVSLLIQLYCVYPLLWYGVRRWGAVRLLMASCLVGWLLRAIGFFYLSRYMVLWHPGAIFLCRLPEFSLGIALAVWMSQSPELIERRLRQRSTVIISAIAYGVGLLLALTRFGNIFAPFVLGLSGFTLLYLLLQNREAWINRHGRWLDWLGQHSYSIYLVHNPIMLPTTAINPPLLLIPAVLLAFGLSLIAAVTLERCTAWMTQVVQAKLTKSMSTATRQ